MLQSAASGSVRISWGDVTFLDGLGAASFFCWTRWPSAAQTNFASLIRKDLSWTPFQQNGTTTNVHSALWTSSGTGPINVRGYTTSATQACLCIYDGTNVTTRVNGSQSSTAKTGSIANSSPPLCFFSNESDAERWQSTGLSECTFWNVALSSADINSLEKGFSPRRVRPQNIIFYSPLVRDIQDLKGSTSYTTSGLSPIAHPRIY